MRGDFYQVQDGPVSFTILCNGALLTDVPGYHTAEHLYPIGYKVNLLHPALVLRLLPAQAPAAALALHPALGAFCLTPDIARNGAGLVGRGYGCSPRCATPRLRVTLSSRSAMAASSRRAALSSASGRYEERKALS